MIRIGLALLWLAGLVFALSEPGLMELYLFGTFALGGIVVLLMGLAKFARKDVGRAA